MLSFSAHKAEQAKLHSQVEDLRSQLDAGVARANALQQQHEEQLNAKEQELNALREVVARQLEAIADVRQQAASIQERLLRYQDQCESLLISKVALQEEVIKHLKDLRQREEKLARLQSDVADAEFEVDQLKIAWRCAAHYGLQLEGSKKQLEVALEALLGRAEEAMGAAVGGYAAFGAGPAHSLARTPSSPISFANGFCQQSGAPYHQQHQVQQQLQQQQQQQQIQQQHSFMMPEQPSLSLVHVQGVASGSGDSQPSTSAALPSPPAAALLSPPSPRPIIEVDAPWWTSAPLPMCSSSTEQLADASASVSTGSYSVAAQRVRSVSASAGGGLPSGPAAQPAAPWTKAASAGGAPELVASSPPRSVMGLRSPVGLAAAAAGAPGAGAAPPDAGAAAALATLVHELKALLLHHQQLDAAAAAAAVDAHLEAGALLPHPGAPSSSSAAGSSIPHSLTASAAASPAHKNLPWVKVAPVAPVPDLSGLGLPAGAVVLTRSPAAARGSAIFASPGPAAAAAAASPMPRAILTAASPRSAVPPAAAPDPAAAPLSAAPGAHPAAGAPVPAPPLAACSSGSFGRASSSRSIGSASPMPPDTPSHAQAPGAESACTTRRGPGSGDARRSSRSGGGSSIAGAPVPVDYTSGRPPLPHHHPQQHLTQQQQEQEQEVIAVNGSSNKSETAGAGSSTGAGEDPAARIERLEAEKAALQRELNEVRKEAELLQFKLLTAGGGLSASSVPAGPADSLVLTPPSPSTTSNIYYAGVSGYSMTHPPPTLPLQPSQPPTLMSPPPSRQQRQEQRQQQQQKQQQQPLIGSAPGVMSGPRVYDPNAALFALRTAGNQQLAAQQAAQQQEEEEQQQAAAAQAPAEGAAASAAPLGPQREGEADGEGGAQAQETAMPQCPPNMDPLLWELEMLTFKPSPSPAKAQGPKPPSRHHSRTPSFAFEGLAGNGGFTVDDGIKGELPFWYK